MKFKKILAAVMIVAMLAIMAGCNYVSRPYGAGNNSSDISSTLSELLKVTEYEYAEPNTEPDYIYTGKEEEPPKDETPEEEPPKDETPEENPPEEDEPEPDPVYTPFTSEYDIEKLLDKIDSLIKTVQQNNGVANSATGVSDELLAGRTVKIMVPDDFPIAEENEAVKAMTEQYGCAVNVRRAGTGSAYVAACRKAVLSGDHVDMMYVDNSIWGDVHPFVQPIESFVNFDLADELGTFSSNFSEKFYTINAFEETVDHYYVASGMGAPYLLAYNKDTIKNAILAPEAAEVTIGGVTEQKELREIEVVDPVAMYNNRTWGAQAFTEMLKATTEGSHVGLASEIDALEGLDIWYGMLDAEGIRMNSNNGRSVDTLSSRNHLDVNLLQSWYWDLTGADKKNNIGIFEDAEYWENDVAFEKLFGQYKGGDAVRSYSFLACEPEDLPALKAFAEGLNTEWDFVAYPYGATMEADYRVNTEEEFEAKLNADAEGAENPEYDQQIVTPVAGWAGGFAVMKTCQNPSVALRVGEELTKIWLAEEEGSYLGAMTAAQKARYADMKEHMSVSFVRALVEKAADVNATYPGYSELIYGLPGSTSNVVVDNPNTLTTDRSKYLALSYFDDNAQLAVHPMYHKDQANSIYNPKVQTDWEDWMLGAIHPDSESKKETSSVQVILNAATLPATILFDW